MSESPWNEKKDLEHVGGLIDGVVAALGERAGLGPAALLWADWESVSGRAWKDATPARLDRGVLVVAVPNAMTATRLRYETGGLLARIADRIGPDVVSSIRVKVQRPKRST
jgi:hypothetical protein